MHPGAGWATRGGHGPQLEAYSEERRRSLPCACCGAAVSPAVPEGRKRAATSPSSPAASPGTTWGCLAPGEGWDAATWSDVFVPSCVATGAGLGRLAGGTEVATGRRNVPLHVPVSRGPCDLCHRWSHSGDGEMAGEGGHGHAWAQRRGYSEERHGEALGCSRAAARLRPHVPILPSMKGYPRGPCPSPSPIPAPPGTLLGWRCLPGALRPPRTLPAVCFQFLLASAPPCFLPIKKKNPKKKKKIPGIFSACGSQRLERCHAPLWQAGAAWGGDGGCPWHLTSLFMPVYVGGRVGDCPATPPCPGFFLLRSFLHVCSMVGVWDPLVWGVRGAQGCLGTRSLWSDALRGGFSQGSGAAGGHGVTFCSLAG